MRCPIIRLGLFIAFALVAPDRQAYTQDLDPGAYSPNPVGANFLVLGPGDTRGSVLPDPSVPVTDVEAEFQGISLGYGETFVLLDRVASWGVSGQYLWADVSGNVGSDSRRVTRSGLADPRFRLAMNLRGLPPMKLAEFARRDPRPTFGASVVVVPPLGQYRSDRLINLGANRWSVKPEIGFTVPSGRWLFEGAAGVWIFGDNDAFYGQTTREQHPLTSLQAHVSYTIRPRLWLAASMTWYTGGRTTVGSIVKADWQENTRVGVSLSVPLSIRDSVQLRFSSGASTRLGSDFDTFAVLWQRVWFDRP